MEEIERGAAGSLGAWEGTIAVIKRLCDGHYHLSRVKMLYYAVKAFNDLSALNKHRLSLPVDFNDPTLKVRPENTRLIVEAVKMPAPSKRTKSKPAPAQ